MKQKAESKKPAPAAHNTLARWKTLSTKIRTIIGVSAFIVVMLLSLTGYAVLKGNTSNAGGTSTLGSVNAGYAEWTQTGCGLMSRQWTAPNTCAYVCPAGYAGNAYTTPNGVTGHYCGSTIVTWQTMDKDWASQGVTTYAAAQSFCTNNLHRQWVIDAGCAARPSRTQASNVPQCQGQAGFPIYSPGAIQDHDKCIAAPTTTTTGSGTSTSTTPTSTTSSSTTTSSTSTSAPTSTSSSPAPTTAIALGTEASCTLLGRSPYTASTGACGFNCPNGIAMVAFTANNGATGHYCNGYLVTYQDMEKAWSSQGVTTYDTANAFCVNNLHRQWVHEAGCTALPSRTQVSNARQCQPGYPIYSPGAIQAHDKCIPVPGTSGPTTSTAIQAPVTLDNIPKNTCLALGRVVDAPTNQCQQKCPANAGTLVTGTDANKTIYCSKAISTTVDQTLCGQLFRRWMGVGCAQRADGQNNSHELIACIGGHEYYDANFQAAGTLTNIAVCEPSADKAHKDELVGAPNGNKTIVKGMETAGLLALLEAQQAAAAAAQAAGLSTHLPIPTTVTPGAFQISIYSGANFTGTKKTFTDVVPSLKDAGFSGKVGSYKILAGEWSICPKVDYINCVTTWASDPSLADNKAKTGINSLQTIASLRPVTTDLGTTAVANNVDPTCTDSTTHQPVQPNTDNTCPTTASLSCPTGLVLQNGTCQVPLIAANAYRPVDKRFVGAKGERNCSLLGREWISKGNGGDYGCSYVTCKLAQDGAPVHNTYCVSAKYSEPYAENLPQKTCTSAYHRAYITQVSLCAKDPASHGLNYSHTRDVACVGNGLTYYGFKGGNKAHIDECANPNSIQKLEGVFQIGGNGIFSVLKLGAGNYCRSIGKQWAQGQCTTPPAPAPKAPKEASHAPAVTAPDGESWYNYCQHVLHRWDAPAGCERTLNGPACLPGNAPTGKMDKYGYDTCSGTPSFVAGTNATVAEHNMDVKLAAIADSECKSLGGTPNRSGTAVGNSGGAAGLCDGITSSNCINDGSGQTSELSVYSLSTSSGYYSHCILLY